MRGLRRRQGNGSTSLVSWYGFPLYMTLNSLASAASRKRIKTIVRFGVESLDMFMQY